MTSLWLQRAEQGLTGGRYSGGVPVQIMKNSLPNHCCLKLEWVASEVATFPTRVIQVKASYQLVGAVRMTIT